MKSIIFDAGPVISLTTNNLLWTLRELKERCNGSFYITEAVKKFKPDFLINGHIHKALYMFYRNIHCIEAGALKEQDPFMKMIGSPSHVCYWILDLSFNKKGVNKVGIKLFPHY